MTSLFGRSPALAAVLAFIAAVFPGPAPATERQIGQGPAWSLRAAGDWVAWDGIYDQDIIVQYLWHRDRTWINQGRYLHALGTSSDKRAAGLFAVCSGAGGSGRCQLRHRLLRRYAAVTVFTEPPGLTLTGYDEAVGRLALGLRDPGGGGRGGIYVGRQGGELRRISRMRPGRLARGGRVLANAFTVNGWRRIFGFDLGRPGHPLLVAAGYAAETKDATVSGRYAYWLESKRRILRVDLLADRPVEEAYRPKRKPTSFAAARGRIYYARASGGVYEVSDPAWRVTGRGLPIEN
jgi:hypothetical protein